MSFVSLSLPLFFSHHFLVEVPQDHHPSHSSVIHYISLSWCSHPLHYLNAICRWRIQKFYLQLRKNFLLNFLLLNINYLLNICMYMANKCLKQSLSQSTLSGPHQTCRTCNCVHLIGLQFRSFVCSVIKPSHHI